MTTVEPPPKVPRRPLTRYRRVRRRVYHIIQRARHKAGIARVLDYGLMVLILLNSVVAVLESVESMEVLRDPFFQGFELVSVLIFTFEYVLRVWTAVERVDKRYQHPVWGRLRYMLTPLSLVDLFAIAPFYFGMWFEVDLRAMRVLRLLRILKLTRYSESMAIMGHVLRQESRSIGAVLSVFTVALVFVSSLMYLAEHPVQPTVFADVPSAMWWAVETMTTLGYGDMVPITLPGRLLGACTAIIGVGMIALPAGVLASGFNEQLRIAREEYLETAEKAVHDGTISRSQRRHLEDTRLDLGLTHEEAALLLRHAVKGGPPHCPHCGERLEA